MNDQIDYASRIFTGLADSIGGALPGIFAGLLVIAVFYTIALTSRRLLLRLSARIKAEKRPLVELASDTLFFSVITVGLISGLGTMGVDVSALIAGLGLTGFALGFALRDALSNLIAGVLILLYRPFRYGDKITVSGNSGNVVGINFRYTVLQTAEGKIIHVPNGTMFSNSVTVEARGLSEESEI